MGTFGASLGSTVDLDSAMGGGGRRGRAEDRKDCQRAAKLQILP